MITRPNNYGIQSASSLMKKDPRLIQNITTVLFLRMLLFSSCLIPNAMLYVRSFKQIFNSLGMLLRAVVLVSKASAHNLKDETG